MPLYESCPHLPHIPEEIASLLTEENIRKEHNQFIARDGERYEVPWYSIHKANLELTEFLKPYFPETMRISVQLITRELLIHKDKGRTTAYNYVIKSGGNVSTVWFDDDKNEIDRVIFPEREWYKLDLSVFHNVYDVTSTRIAITVNEPVPTN
jgi:hypothetical protein